MATTSRPYDRTSHILIVDDDDTLLKFFKIHLNKFFSRVIVVENAKDAMESIREKDIDMLLTDVRMPKVDGLQLLQKVRKNHPDLPILLISGEPMSQEQQDAIETADGFLSKPFSIDQLNEFIHRGIDLRQTYQELSALLKDPKKLRDALGANETDVAKYFKKESLGRGRELIAVWRNRHNTVNAA